MKKFLCLILICLSCPMVLSSPQTSLNSFEIPINEVPPGSKGGSKDSGLSDGAVTAITLGSVFGGLAAIGGLGWYFTKCTSGLACGCACGVETPLIPVFLKEFCHNFSQTTYLKKAFDLSNKSPDKKYLFISDSEIKTKTYNTVIFEVPTDMPNFKIIQVADGFLDSKIIDSTTIIPLKSNYKNGVLIKQGQLTKCNSSVALVTENHSCKKVYAIVIEFSP